jgi:ATP-binding cassette subfamily B protein
MVTQETYLFHDTIRTNLIYAKPDATQDLKLNPPRAPPTSINFIMDSVRRLRHHRRRTRISPQRRRKTTHCLARVILKDPRILVLDEATSHLDSESESLIQEALKRVMAGAHQL